MLKKITLTAAAIAAFSSSVYAGGFEEGSVAVSAAFGSFYTLENEYDNQGSKDKLKFDKLPFFGEFGLGYFVMEGFQAGAKIGYMGRNEVVNSEAIAKEVDIKTKSDATTTLKVNSTSTIVGKKSGFYGHVFVNYFYSFTEMIGMFAELSGGITYFENELIYSHNYKASAAAEGYTKDADVGSSNVTFKHESGLGFDFNVKAGPIFVVTEGFAVQIFGKASYEFVGGKKIEKDTEYTKSYTFNKPATGDAPAAYEEKLKTTAEIKAPTQLNLGGGIGVSFSF